MIDEDTYNVSSPSPQGTGSVRNQLVQALVNGLVNGLGGSIEVWKVGDVRVVDRHG